MANKTFYFVNGFVLLTSVVIYALISYHFAWYRWDICYDNDAAALALFFASMLACLPWRYLSSMNVRIGSLFGNAVITITLQYLLYRDVGIQNSDGILFVIGISVVFYIFLFWKFNKEEKEEAMFDENNLKNNNDRTMEKVIKLDVSKTLGFISQEDINNRAALAKKCNEALHNGSGKGSDYLGWLNLPSSITDAQLTDIEETAKSLRAKCQVIVLVGIGGSYLGSKAVIDSLSNYFDWLQTDRKNPVILYAGNNISEDYISELLAYLQGKSFGIINISKSGTTTEPALSFRILKGELEKTVGKGEAKNRIVAITDGARGALHTLAKKEGYKMYVIPDNVGGRFSVLAPVGLLPIALAGIDIRQIVAGAALMEKETAPSVAFENNIAEQYAVVRNELYNKGKKIEILANYHPKLHFIAEWWKQLYGESEGKENKGIFNAAVDFTADLHSMGQWIQEGERTIFETVISIAQPNSTVLVPTDEQDLDGLNFLTGKNVDFVNKMAELGTQIAHIDGGVPNIKIEMPKLDAYSIGQLLYFFEKGCGISGYILDVNPFDQPGVEAYKKNMFALLEKPGYEKETEAIKKRI